jgi:predicted nuclease of predicted toxin-antitoxin system
MKILLDMNLSPDWVPVLESAGFEAVHWSTIGNPSATDKVIMAWALTNDYIVFTHDLDFGTLLAMTQADAPSVIQVRSQDILPANLGNLVINALRQFQQELEMGALVTVDEAKAKVRILPIQRNS